MLRRDLNGFLTRAGVPRPRLEQVILVAHELAANAIEHGPPRSRPIAVEVTLDEQDVLVRVRSEAAAPRVTANTPADTDERGRGLMIVGAIADWWESQDGDDHIVTARLIAR